MAEIVPTIIAKDFNELKEKIRRVEPYFSIVQLDVADGRFVANETFRNPEKIKEIKTSLNWEIHLMTEKPEEQIYSWSLLRPKRIIFHFEACLPTGQAGLPDRQAVPGPKIKSLIQKIKNYGMEAGIAINPETPVEGIKEFLDDLDLALLMSVNPGFGGQEFIEAVLPKIKALREIWPDGKIEVDGGIKIGVAKKCAEAGADILAIGSAIWEAENIKEAIEILKNDVC